MRRSRERCPARLRGFHKPAVWLAYREVRRRPARAAARAPRGAALRTGPKGGAKIPPGSRVREHISPVRKNGPVQTKHRGGAPVGEAARSQGPQAHPRTVSMLKARHPALRSLSPVRESEEKTRRCAPASVERGGGALAVSPLPCGERSTRQAKRGAAGEGVPTERSGNAVPLTRLATLADLSPPGRGEGRVRGDARAV